MLRTFFRQLMTMSLKTYLTAFSAWFVMAAAVLGIQVAREIKHQEQIFEQKSAMIYALIQQRLDQNEAVLSGLEAMLDTFDDVQAARVRGYARQMLARYPHLYTVGLQPRVSQEDRASFERHAARTITAGYQIRDLAGDGNLNLHSSVKRAFYYPVTFMEPLFPDAAPALGRDLYSNKKIREAIDASILSQNMAASAPFNLFEGGRGYILIAALFNTSAPAAEYETRHAQATRTVSLLIRTSKLLRTDEFSSDQIEVLLYNKNYSRADPNGQIFHVGQTAQIDRQLRLFPTLYFSRSLPGTSQPFMFETHRQLGWEVFRVPATLATLLATLLLTMLVSAVVNLRHRHAHDTRISEEMLFRERERALVTLDSISDAVLTLDANGIVESMNPATEIILCRPLDTCIGKPVADVLVLEYELSKTLTANPFSRCIAMKATIDLPENSVLVGSGGQHILVEGSCSPLFNRAQQLIGVVVALRDMGPIRRQALASIEAGEKRLRQHQAELAHVARLNTMGEMASGIAHEINQPLAAILSYNQACVRMLQDDEANIEEIVAAMKSAAAQSQRVGAIIARLRAFVSKQVTHRGPVDLNQVVKNSLVLIEHTLRDKQVTVTVNLLQPLPAIIADSIQLEQIVLNLIRNAIDAMEAVAPAERCVNITTAQDGNSVRVTVQDHGDGIAPDVFAQLFDPFFTTKEDGMGLGLTISQSIAETYGGKLVATNLSNGGGEFNLFLPIPPAINKEFNLRGNG